MPPTIQELQRSFEYKYDCIFKAHSNPNLGQICVPNCSGSGYNFNSQWYNYVREEIDKYSDQFAGPIIPSDTRSTRITAWNMMYSDFYDRYMATMPLRRTYLQALVEERVRQQVKDAVDKAIKIAELNRIYDQSCYIEKLDKISRIVKENPLYTRAEVEAIVRYLDPTNYSYAKNTLSAVKALHRFSRDNRIDFNSSVKVWKEYL